MTAWIFNIISSPSFFQLLEWFGRGGTFADYAVLTVMGALLRYCFMPETRGLTLKQIERYRYEKRPLRSWTHE